jgi:biotin carboxylase
VAKLILVLGGRLNVIEGAREAGVEVVLLHHPGGYEPRAAQLCEEIVHVDFTDVEQVAAHVRRWQARRPVDRVVSLTEEGLMPAAVLNSRFGLGGNTVQSVRLLLHKDAMRRHLADVGMSDVRYRVVAELKEAADFLTHTWAMVMKPLHGTASRGIHIVRSGVELEAAWERLRSEGYLPALAEELLEGREISVEAFSAEGEHVIVGTTQKTLNAALVEVGHTTPAGITPEEASAAAELTTRFLTAVGLTEGPSHTELMLTADGPRIIESHNRIGGGRLRDLVWRAYGLDLARLAVSVPLGLEPAPATAPVPTGGAAIRFFQPPPGVVTEVVGVDRYRDDLDLELDMPLKPGDRVNPIEESFDRIYGSVLAWGPSAQDAVGRCERVLSDVQVKTNRVMARSEAT